MQTTNEAARRSIPSRSRGAKRRSRLKRAIQVWNLDRRLCAERTRRVAQITLTVAADDLDAAQGAARDFWNRVRQRFVGTRYFCWAELQRRGQVHYHALWLNPPGRKRADLLYLVAKWWGLGRTQVRFQDARWAEDKLLDYALKYADKMGSKRYQQAYELMPRGMRTFMSHRLEIPPDELKLHLERDDYRYHPPQVYKGEQVDEWLELVGHILHQVDPEHRCTAPEYRRTKARAPAGPPRAGPRSASKRARHTAVPSCTRCLHARREHHLVDAVPYARRCARAGCSCAEYAPPSGRRAARDRRSFDGTQPPLTTAPATADEPLLRAGPPGPTPDATS